MNDKQEALDLADINETSTIFSLQNFRQGHRSSHHGCHQFVDLFDSRPTTGTA